MTRQEFEEKAAAALVKVASAREASDALGRFKKMVDEIEPEEDRTFAYLQLEGFEMARLAYEAS